jgi:competence protein ComEC
MKLPALFVSAAMACGIALSTRIVLLPAALAAVIAATLLAGLLLLRRGALWPAWMAGLAAWVFLGALALQLHGRDVSPDNVATLIGAGQIDAHEPLRWHGRLREGPERLPSGTRYDVDLEEVEIAGRSMHVSGGLRATLRAFPGREWTEPATVRPGDRIELLLRARVPRNYLDPGAFDERESLARQGIDVTGSLRDGSLLVNLGEPPPRWPDHFARLRNRLLGTLEALFPDAPDAAAVLRAMLLGDRSFVEHDVVRKFQQTAVYHVLVIAGLHVAALAAFIFWMGRRLRLPLEAIVLFTLAVLLVYLLVVEDRPPILRAGLMATVVLGSRLFYRRLDLLNTVAVAALVILCAKPAALLDSSFQLSMTAVAAIGALAIPALARTTAAFEKALDHLDDFTRDASHPPRAAQFRMMLRMAVEWVSWRLPRRTASLATPTITQPCRLAFWLWDLVVISLAIQMGMLPLLALDFHRVALAGPAANVPAVVLTGLIVPLGFLCLAVGMISIRLAGPLALLLHALVGILVGSVSWFARLPRLSYRIPGPPGWLTACYLAAFALLAVLLARGVPERPATPRLRLARFACAAICLALVLMVATYPFAPRLERGKLEATVLDVGQGDSILVAFPDGHTLLVDGGGTALAPLERETGRPEFDVGEEVVAPYLWERGLKRLDAVVLTHGHRDHLDGLYAVLEDFSVAELWIGREITSPGFRALEEEARVHGTRIVHRQRGDVFVWGEVKASFLWPDSDPPADKAKNDDSLVLRLEFGKVRYLLPGDIERPVEHQLLARGDALAADFLKIAHHGSKTSTTPDFLAAVAPRVAVISAGAENPYGHPSPVMLKEFEGRGARVLRTDRDGAVSVTTDGRAVNTQTYVQERLRE